VPPNISPRLIGRRVVINGLPYQDQLQNHHLEHLRRYNYSLFNHSSRDNGRLAFLRVATDVHCHASQPAGKRPSCRPPEMLISSDRLVYGISIPWTSLAKIGDAGLATLKMYVYTLPAVFLS
jgi:hypothetical protein